MAKHMRRRRTSQSKKEGLPPGTPLYVGELRDDTVAITAFHYDRTTLEEFVATDLDALRRCRNTGRITWVNVSGIHRVELVEQVCKAFGVHSLAVEDICSTETRPKSEEYDDHLYLVVKMLTVEKDPDGEHIHAEHTSVVVGDKFVLTFQEEHEGDVFDAVRRRLRDPRARMRQLGEDYLAYAVVDAVVDHYFSVLEWIGDRAEELEERVLARPDPGQLAAIYLLRREITFFRKQVWPLRDGLGLLMRSDSKRISSEVVPFLRDVHDHTVQVVESVELYREIVLGLVDLYMSNVSQKLNEVMKVLTIIATIFIPLTFVVGVYGMNFDYMPELHWKYGYALTWALMLGVVAVMLAGFRYKRWI
ncbi:MAG: magnesium/cobalt transporter CorA [Deltaproteobacteria bacterium]|nr:magnesium/cobalt transporter CorA [Deltaproteobacteria bacterium]